MMQHNNVGFVGVGAYLPPEVRKNDWWPDHVVARWIEKRDAGRAKHAGGVPQAMSEGVLRVVRAMHELGHDPFQGAVERRVMPEGMRSSDMELHAAREAIAAAGIDPKEIGLVLCNSGVPDHLVTNNACLLHHRLELSSRCLAMGTEGACNSFTMSSSLAQQMIASGQVKYALIAQSCSGSLLLDYDSPISAWFGDGASAVVLGPVSKDRGILSQVHTTDGRFHQALVAGVPSRRWYDDGRVVLYSADTQGARDNFLAIAEMGKEVVDAALAEAGCKAEDVDFFAVHQGTPWLRRVTQEHFGLQRARSVETFKFAASLSSSNIPLGFALGQREGLLRDGDLVLMFSGGAGNTCSSMVLRWGNG